VAEFLCLPAGEAAIAMAVEATSFARLQAQERETGFAESPRHAAAFFREGTADGWRRVLTPAQADHIVAAHGDVMRRLGYDVTLAPLPQPIATIEPPRLRTDGPGHACCGRQRPRGGAMTTPYPRDMIGYGAEPPAAQWPGEARIALQFVINYEEGAENAILHGDPAAEAFLSEWVGAQPTLGMRNMNIESLYEYGSRAGFWRLHRAFLARGVPVTVYGVAMALERNPPAVAAMLAADWEIATHGYRWIDYQYVAESVERDHIAKAVELHTRVTGTRPLGWYQG